MRILPLIYILLLLPVQLLAGRELRPDSVLALCERLNTQIQNATVPQDSMMELILMADEARNEADVVRDADAQYGPEVKSQVCRTVGLYYLNVITDHPTALAYGFKALDLARQSQHADVQVDALNLLSAIYFHKSDSTGYDYARQALALSQDIGLLQGIYTSACNVSNYLFNKSQYRQAMDYLQQAIALARREGWRRQYQYLYSFEADICAALDSLDAAERLYMMSMQDLPETSGYDKLYARICYATFLSQRHRYHESLTYAAEVIRLKEEWGIEVFDLQIYQLLANVHEQMQHPAEALTYYKEFARVHDYMVGEEKEKAARVMELKQEVDEQKRKNAEQEMQLLRQSRALWAWGSVMVVVLVTLAFVWILYRRREMRYREIVRQQLDKIEGERRLRLQFERTLQELQQLELASCTGSGVKYGNSSLSEEKGSNLYMQLEELMRCEHLYADPLLSIEKLAEQLQTNRTYLSQVINEQAGVTYSSYINNFRIDAALALLSDPANLDVSLKEIAHQTGFNSLSSFYTLFKKKVGIAPSIYRENVLKLPPKAE